MNMPELQEMKDDLKNVKSYLRGKGYDLKLNGITGRDKMKLVLKKEDKMAQITLLGLGDRRCDILWNEKTDKELTLFLLEKVENLFSRWKISMIQVTSEYELENEGYVKLEGKWLKQIRGEEKFLFQLAKQVTKVLKEIQNDHEMFQFEMGTRFNQERDLWINVRTMYQNERIEMWEWETEGKVQVYVDQVVQSYTMEGLSTFLKERFWKEEKTAKMKNLFHRNHPLLFHFIERNEYTTFFRSEKEKIANLLLREFQYEELEIMAKEKMDRKEELLEFHMAKKSVIVVPFGDVFLWMKREDRKNKRFMKIKVEKDKDKVIQEFKNIVAEWTIGGKRMELMETL